MTRRKNPSTQMEELRNRATGMTLRVIRGGDGDPSQDLLLEAMYPPASTEPPDHFHPVQHEYFQVVRGGIAARVGGSTRHYAEGEAFDIPPGTRHAMWNPTQQETVLLWRTSPALGTLALFRKLYELANDGKTTSAGTPRLLQSAVLARAYRKELRVTTPPQPIQTVALGLLAPVGRLLGFTAVARR